MTSQNHRAPEGFSAPTPACQRFAPLMAAFAELHEVSEVNSGQTPDEASDLAQARDHLATCAYCQRELRAYTRLDATLRSAMNATPLLPLETEDIMRHLISASQSANMAETLQEEEPTSAADAQQTRFALVNVGADTADDAEEDKAVSAKGRDDDQGDQDDQLVYSPLPGVASFTFQTRMARIKRRMGRASVALGAVAAVLIVALLLVGVFRAVDFSHRYGPTSTQKNHSASFVSPYPTAIALTSPTDGWIAGVDNQVYDAANSTASNGSIFFLHEQHGVWTPIQTNIAAEGHIEGSTPPAAITSISMISPTDGWAAGGFGMLLHYDGQSWRAAPTNLTMPNAMAYFTGIQMLSPTNGWLVAGGSPAGQEIFHYDGRQWTPQALPGSLGDGVSVSVALQGLEMLPTGEGWAVGSLQPIMQAGETSNPTPSGLILHYVNGKWSVQAILKGMTLLSVSMTSSGEGWAVGHRDDNVNLPGGPGNLDAQTPVIVHFSHGQWAPIADPLVSYYSPTHPYLDTGQFTRVKMLSPTNGWIVGQSTVPLQYQGDYAFSDTLLLHYDGAAWRLVTLPPIKVHSNDEFASADLLAITPNGDGWLVGTMSPPYKHGVQPINRILLYRYHAGVWSIAQS